MKEYVTWGNKSDKGTSVKKKLLCSPPGPNKMLDMSNIVPPVPSAPATPCSTLGRMSTRLQLNGSQLNGSILNGSVSNGSQVNGSVSMHSTLTRSRKISQDNIQKQDDEHRLISLYAQKLQTEKLNNNSSAKEAENTANNSVVQPSEEEREMLSSLEEKNRTLLQEIQQLKAEHEVTTKNAQQMGTTETSSVDPNLLSELRVLRQRKDELEMRMSTLQETRRTLMVELEGLMKFLKNTEPNHVVVPPPQEA